MAPAADSPVNNSAIGTVSTDSLPQNGRTGNERMETNELLSRAATLLAIWALQPILFLTPQKAFTAPLGSSVRGVVLDPDSRPVSQATITLQSATSEWQQPSQTGAHGEFTFSAVPLGDYALTVTQSGFATVSQSITVSSSG